MDWTTVLNLINCHRSANVIIFQMLKDIRAQIGCDGRLTVLSASHTKCGIYKSRKREEEKVKDSKQEDKSGCEEKPKKKTTAREKKKHFKRSESLVWTKTEKSTPITIPILKKQT